MSPGEKRNPGIPVRGQCGGGADRIRTDDPLLAKQVLYQLSYDPGKGRTN